jgi:hydrogenase maturation protease
VSTNAKNIAALGEAVAPERQIVIAAVGVDWTAAGDPVARRLGERELPSGVSVHELGTGALDIAYDVMRGYDAAVLIDVSPPAGSADVTEADEKAIDATIEDGQELNPNAMDVPTVLHFIKHTGGWPGKVMLVPCDPAGGDDAAAEAVDRAFATIEELRSA